MRTKLKNYASTFLLFWETRISFPHKWIFLTFTCFYFYLYGIRLLSSIGNILSCMFYFENMIIWLPYVCFFMRFPYNKHDLWILKYYNFNRISFCKLLHSFTYNAQSIQQNVVTCNHNLSNKWGMVSKWLYVHVV